MTNRITDENPDSSLRTHELIMEAVHERIGALAIHKPEWKIRNLDLAAALGDEIDELLGEKIKRFCESKDKKSLDELLKKEIKDATGKRDRLLEQAGESMRGNVLPTDVIRSVIKSYDPGPKMHNPNHDIVMADLEIVAWEAASEAAKEINRNQIIARRVPFPPGSTPGKAI